jgi:predicted RNA binding protein YcfA (HicA-like mRNA interferase family)
VLRQQKEEQSVHGDAYGVHHIAPVVSQLAFELRIGLVKVRDVIRLIEADGWRHVRTTGSHRHYKHPQKPNVVTVPGHPGDDLPAGTLKSIMRSSGLEPRK